MITNISNAYIGDASISRIYQGDELVYINSHPDILLEYICTGSADDVASSNIFFDTSIQFSKDIKIETKCLPWGGYSIIGMLGGWTHCPYYGLSYDLNNNGIRFYCGSYDGNGVEYSVFQECEEDVRTITTYFTDTNICMTIDGSTIIGDTYTSLPVFPGTISLFSNGSGPESKIYYFKIWESNNLVRFYIPVLHWTNNYYVPCFYDKVNDNYVYSDWFNGRGFPENFNHLAYPSTIKMTGDYLLDYLGAPPEQSIPNTTSYIMRYDSDVVADTSLATDVKFRLVYGRENFIFGSGTSGQTTPTWQQYSLLCPGNFYRVNFNSGSREEGAISAGLINDSSAVYDVHTLSTYFEEGKSRIYLDDSFVWQTTFVSSYISSNTIHLFSRHGDASYANAGAGSRIYYINFTKSNIPAKTYVPVFHNNQAAFLDLNSGTYIYNIGTYAPYYQFKR